ncbi:hypothetical protein [Ekhidna sp.]|uniref:hypothetical protein n=1 Tax=Ekhidna sp. TaxID=2608089 RepID=UPI003B5138F0
MKISRYIIILIVSIIVVDNVFSMLFSRIYSDTFSGQSGGKINYFISQKNHVSLLALGDSRCAHHVIPKRLSENGYNLSHNGLSLIFHAGLADFIINNSSVQIDTLLIHIGKEEPFNSSNNLDDIRFLKQYYGANEWITHTTDSLFTFDKMKHFFASYKWNGIVLSTVKNWIQSDLPPKNGYKPIPPSQRDSINVYWSIQNATDRQDSMQEFDESFIKLIDHLKRLCNEKEIVLVCFSSPSYPVLLDDPSNDLLKIFFSKLDIFYVDFEKGNLDEIGLVWLWKDMHHLNSLGAEVYSKKLHESLMDLGSLN